MPWKCGNLFSCCCRKSAEDIRELNFNHCSLKEVPSSVFAHERTLEELHMEANRIIDLPRALFHCHELRILNLSDNDIKVLPPAIASLINLKQLNLSKNSLAMIPDNIKCCKQLAYLNVSVNPLDKLPDGFTQLIALEELYLNDTFLEFLPANFGRLSRLRTLDLRENHLNTLPKSIARLANLEMLDIGRNEFSDLPEVIGNLPELNELWADCNKIRTIPSFIGNLTKLANLDVANNNIKWVAPEIENCSSMSYLILSGNELTSLPEEIGNLKNLTMLKLDENDLEFLPRSIGKLTNLEELVFSQNIIDSIPPTIGLLRKVSLINADDNRLSELPSELCSCASLRVLSVRNNELIVMPAEIGHLTGVKIINIADNLLRNLPVSILNLTNLNALWLSTNQSTPLTTLQQEIDPRTGLMVCVNFMFPQQDQERNLKKPDNDDCEALSLERPPRPHIRFADSTDLRNTSRLTRAPTPYPKELRSMAKHARILTTKPIPHLQDSDEEMPLVDDHGKVVDDDDDRPRWPVRTMMSRTSLSPVRLSDQPRVNYEGSIPCSESDANASLLAEDKNEHRALPPPADEEYRGLPAPNQFGAGENASLPAENAIGLMSVAPILATRSDLGPPITSTAAASGVEDGLAGNEADFPAMTATLSMPLTGAAHYGRLLTDQVQKLRSVENIPSEMDLAREAGLIETVTSDGDPATPDDADSAENALVAQVKVPPPYHIAAIHSKQAAFFMNTSNGQGTEEGANNFTGLPATPTSSGNVASTVEPKAVILDTDLLLDKEGSIVPDDVPTIDTPVADKADDYILDLSGLTLSDVDVSPRSNIPVLKSKDSGMTVATKPLPIDIADDASVKPHHISPRESPLSKIPSFTTKDPKLLSAKKSSGVPVNNPLTKLLQTASKTPSKLIQPSATPPSRLIQPITNTPTKLLQPGFHAAHHLPKSPTVIPFPEPEVDYAAMANSPTNGNRNEVDNAEGGGFGNGNEADGEVSLSESNSGTGGFKSRIPARVSPVKGTVAPNSPTSPTWVFGQHKNPTVFPLTLVKSPGLGFSICSGTATPEKPDALGIYVSKVQANGPASGALMPGDKILEVDGVDFAKIDYDQATGILRQTNNVVQLMVSRQK